MRRSNVVSYRDRHVVRCVADNSVQHVRDFSRTKPETRIHPLLHCVSCCIALSRKITHLYRVFPDQLCICCCASPNLSSSSLSLLHSRVLHCEDVKFRFSFSIVNLSILKCYVGVFAMNRKLTAEQRVFVVERWWYHHKKTALVVDDFMARFPNVPPPSRQAMRNLCIRFHAHGYVQDSPRSGRPRTTRTPDNMDLVAESCVHEPHTSTRRRSAELGINRCGLRRMLKELHFKSYRPKLLHALHPDDGGHRIQFAETFLIRNEADPDFFKNILWSDEASFKLNGQVNRWNSVYWATDNPHEITTAELNVPGITCWAGIWSGGILGPHFFEGTVTGEHYRQLLEESVLPEIQHAPHFANHAIIFQQDGAPPHWSVGVRSLLDDTCPEWIGRGGTIPWPARSCDLTPCDFAMWGIVKDEVYARHPTDLHDLRLGIETSFARLNDNPALCSRICASVSRRCTAVLEHGGLHFEQYL